MFKFFKRKKKDKVKRKFGCKRSPRDENDLYLDPITNEVYKKVYVNWTSDSKTTQFLSWDVHENDEVTKFYIESKIEPYETDFFFDWVVVRK